MHGVIWKFQKDISTSTELRLLKRNNSSGFKLKTAGTECEWPLEINGCHAKWRIRFFPIIEMCFLSIGFFPLGKRWMYWMMKIIRQWSLYGTKQGVFIFYIFVFFVDLSKKKKKKKKKPKPWRQSMRLSSLVNFLNGDVKINRAQRYWQLG